MSRPVTTDDRAKFDAALRDINEIKKSYMDIGVNEDAGNYADGTSVAEVAFWNEYGTVKIPERSFLRAAVDEKKDELDTFQNEVLEDVVNQKYGVIQGLRRFAFRVTTEIKNKITTLKEPPNAASTIKKKGFDNPLIHSRKMLNSIDYKIDGV